MKINPVVLEDFGYIQEKVDLRELEGKSVLITGATGMLASYMVDILLLYNDTCMHKSKKISIYALARDEFKIHCRFPYIKNRDDFRPILHDMSLSFSSQDRYDYIIHAASNASPKFYKIDPAGTLLSNIMGMISLLRHAENYPLKSFLFFSSGEIYGDQGGQDGVVSEDNYGVVNPLDLRSCYAESKRAGEALAAAWCEQYGVPVKIVRPFHVYGPGMNLKDGRVFADFVSDIINKRDIVMRSDGSARRAFCYIADATVAFLTILLRGEVGLPYNVGNPEGDMSVRQLAEMLVSLYPSLNLSIRFDYPKENYIPSKIVTVIPDIERMKCLGWKPIFMPEKGFERTIRSYEYGYPKE